MKNFLVKIVSKSKPSSELWRDKAFLIHADKRLIEIFIPNPEKISDYELTKRVSEFIWSDLDLKEIELDLGSSLSKEQQTLVYETILLKAYKFNKYKTKDKAQCLTKIKLINQAKFSHLDKILNSVNFCRDIISANADEVNPAYLESLAESIVKKCPGMSIKVISANEAKKMGMGCLMAVGAESFINGDPESHPRLVILEYTPENIVNEKSKESHLAIVGKGISFDTGGLCLKPNNYMLDMKSDMSGAATVLSLFHLIAELSLNERKKIKHKLTGVMALAENAFGGASYKPGDVLKALNGKTVEVVDTDAEGRLVLADALSYLSKLKSKPSHVIDLATLTGSMVATLGEAAAGAMTNDETFFNSVQAAFGSAREKLWLVPLLDEYKKKVDSDIADLAHCSSRPDAIIAGHFLSNFIPKDSKWVHLDIAGVAFIENDGLLSCKGATGFGVRGLYRLIQTEY